MFFLNLLLHIQRQRAYYHRWFWVDKPARIAGGAGPDGLFNKERSEADKERIGTKSPDELGKCAAELRRRWG